MVSAAQRFNIVAAQDKSVAAPVQRFKSVATNVLTKHESSRVYIVNLPSWGPQRDVVYLNLTNSALVYLSQMRGRWGVAGYQPMRTAVHMERK